MRMLTLRELESEVERLAKRIGATGYTLPTYGRSEDLGRHHLEVDRAGYHYVVVERGEELRRVTSKDLDEVLWRVFQGITFQLACEHELNHRAAGQDCRRQIFSKQEELLGALSGKWSQRAAAEHEEILKRHPFVDGV